MTALASARASLPVLDTDRKRTLRHALDFVQAAVWAQIRAEFNQYFLGWLWWILEPVTSALTFFFVVFLFFHLPGDRLWIIIVSVIAFRWFGRSVDIAAHLASQFAPFVRTGGVSMQLLFVTFLAKETIVFAIAMTVIMIPVAIWAHPLSPHLLELPLVIICQGLLVYWASALAMIIGGLVHDVGKVIGLLVSIWFYFSPGLYIRTDAAHLPHLVLDILQLNPFWTILSAWQSILVRGKASDVGALLLWIAVNAIVCVLATRLLGRTRRALTLASSE
jgi:lipopolysaccharide transport system permease protein